jgi:hypothetical protein
VRLTGLVLGCLLLVSTFVAGCTDGRDATVAVSRLTDRQVGALAEATPPVVTLGVPGARLRTGRLDLVLYGSSSCPWRPVTATRVGRAAVRIGVRRDGTSGGFCTSDLAPTGWRVTLPASLRGRDRLSVVVAGLVRPDGQGPVTIVATT